MKGTLFNVTGLLAAMSLVCLASGQTFNDKALPVACRCQHAWPPKLQDMVNVDSLNDPASNQFGQVELQPGASHPIFSVPSGQYLVVTAFSVGSEYWALQEVLGSAVTWKTLLSGASFNFSGGPGVAFAPNSDVRIYNGLGGYARTTGYKLVGYLTD